MKTKQEILKMSKKELKEYKWDGDLNKKEPDCTSCSHCINCTDCINCSHCSDCSYCYCCIDCSHCSDCSYCRNLKNKKYCICNVQLTKEEYEKKLKEVEELI